MQSAKNARLANRVCPKASAFARLASRRKAVADNARHVLRLAVVRKVVPTAAVAHQWPSAQAT
jgi:hypothetical protein